MSGSRENPDGVSEERIHDDLSGTDERYVRCRPGSVEPLPGVDKGSHASDAPIRE